MFVGRHTYGTEHIKIRRWAESKHYHKLYIGSFSSIADDCEIYLGGNHYTDLVTSFPFGLVAKDAFPNADFPENPNLQGSSSKGDVVIDSDVWIGSHVTIMSGVHIGDGAVIAANSHVVKDVPPYAIVGGNPAKIIRYRFAPDHVEALLRIQWYMWPDHVINERIRDIVNPEVETLIEKYDPALQHQIYRDSGVLGGKSFSQFQLRVLESYSPKDATETPILHTLENTKVHVTRDRDYLMPCVIDKDDLYINLSNKHTSYFHYQRDYMVDGTMKFAECIESIFEEPFEVLEVEKRKIQVVVDGEERDALGDQSARSARTEINNPGPEPVYYFMDNYNLLASHFFEDVMQFLYAYNPPKINEHWKPSMHLLCPKPDPKDPRSTYYAETLAFLQIFFKIKYVHFKVGRTVEVPRLVMTKTYGNYIDPRAKAFWDKHVIHPILQRNTLAELFGPAPPPNRVALLKTHSPAHHTTHRSYEKSPALLQTLQEQGIYLIGEKNENEHEKIALLHQAEEIYVTWGAIYYINFVYNMLSTHRCPKVHVIYHPGYMHERKFLKEEIDQEDGKETVRLDMGADDLAHHATNYMNTVIHYGRTYENVDDEGLIKVLGRGTSSVPL